MDNIADKVKEVISNLLQDKEIELVDITYRREQGGMVLRLIVEKKGGITLGDCTYLNEEIGKMLDAEDIIPERYTLEVSSPGVDRPLKTKRDFEKVLGKKVHVHTYQPVNNKRDHEGLLISVDDEKIIVGNVEIGLNSISKARLKIEF